MNVWRIDNAIATSTSLLDRLELLLMNVYPIDLSIYIYSFRYIDIHYRSKLSGNIFTFHKILYFEIRRMIILFSWNKPSIFNSSLILIL